jgi:hypothetical protein
MAVSEAVHPDVRSWPLISSYEPFLSLLSACRHIPPPRASEQARVLSRNPRRSVTSARQGCRAETLTRTTGPPFTFTSPSPGQLQCEFRNSTPPADEHICRQRRPFRAGNGRPGRYIDQGAGRIVSLRSPRTRTRAAERSRNRCVDRHANSESHRSHRR